jgi:hypothetical protein
VRIERIERIERSGRRSGAKIGRSIANTASYGSSAMRTFRWLVVASVVVGAILGGATLAF